jgi:hypothetical protein
MKVEWLILGDYVELVGGKLYVMGGGWDVLTVNTAFPLTKQCGVAASFRIPWDQTNQRHNVEVEILTEDGQQFAKIGGQVEVGRPAGIAPGQDQRAQLAGNLMLTFQQAGRYTIVARVEGQEQETISFGVVEGPLMRRAQAS